MLICALFAFFNIIILMNNSPLIGGLLKNSIFYCLGITKSKNEDNSNLLNSHMSKSKKKKKKTYGNGVQYF